MSAQAAARSAGSGTRNTENPDCSRAPATSSTRTGDPVTNALSPMPPSPPRGGHDAHGAPLLVVPKQDLGHTGRLGLPLDLEGAVQRELQPAGHRLHGADLGAHPHPRA